MSNVSIVGIGYVGLVTAVCLADKGCKVLAYTHNQNKADLINNGKPPFFEEGLEDILGRVVSNGDLCCTTDIKETVLNSDISFIATGTPSLSDGSINLSFIESVSVEIGEILRHKVNYHVIVVKSTVIPGTTQDIVKPAVEKYSNRLVGRDIGLCMNPEFLREGSAIYDTLNPDRIVIGGVDDRSINTLEALYKSFYKENIPILRTGLSTAEMIKYVSNSFLASRVSLINEIANICEKTPGVDVNQVVNGVGLDTRIGSHFLKAGAGFGGSCFPKDVKALISYSETKGYEPIILKSVLKTNEKQSNHIVELVRRELTSLTEKKIAILGLSFKPDTDDMREAPAVRVINLLLTKGAKVTVYDPRAVDNAKKIFGKKIDYANSTLNCLEDADCCILMTEWDEFKQLSTDDFIVHMKTPILVDGRRIYDPTLFSMKLKYVGVGLGERSI